MGIGALAGRFPSRAGTERNLKMRKPWRAAVIGHTGRGDYGHQLDQVWLEVPGVELVGVADPDPAGRAAAAKRLGLARGYEDYRQMLDELRPDVVSIGPRWIDRHAELVEETAGRGIHIYLEKPFCRTLVEADRIVDACDRSHVKLALALQTRYSPKLPVVKRILSEGRIGSILEIRARGKEDGRGGLEDLWVLGTHVLDLMRVFGGPPRWCLASIEQQGRPIRRADLVEGSEGLGPLAGDRVSAMFGLAGSSVGYFQSTRGAGGNPSRFGIQIMGSQGVLEVLPGYLPSVRWLPDPSWSPGRSGQEWVAVSSQGIGGPEPLADGGLPAGNVLAVKDLLAAIEEDRPPVANAGEARATLEMIMAILAAAVRGGRVDWPLQDRSHPLARLS